MFEIRSTTDGHLIDTAESNESLECRTWWRRGRSFYVTRVVKS